MSCGPCEYVNATCGSVKGMEFLTGGRAVHGEIKICLQSSYVINDFGSYVQPSMYKVPVISLIKCKKILRK